MMTPCNACWKSAATPRVFIRYTLPSWQGQAITVRPAPGSSSGRKAFPFRYELMEIGARHHRHFAGGGTDRQVAQEPVVQGIETQCLLDFLDVGPQAGAPEGA